MKIKHFLVLGSLLALASGALLADYDSAMAQFKSGRYPEAAAEFQTLVDEAPGYDYGYYMLGLSFFKMGKNDDAATNIQKALDLNGDKFPYHHALASVYRAKRENTKALSVLNDAEGLVTDNTKYQFYYLRGFVHLDLDHWADAINDLEKVRASKTSPQVEEALGTAYFKLSHYDKAVPRLREAARLNPSDESTQMLLAEALINLARESDAKAGEYFAEALRAANKYRSMNPSDYRADNLVGRAALGAEDFDSAADAFRKVISVKPDYCYAHVNLAKCMIATEDWVQAERVSRQAIKCAPKLPAGYESLGYALQKQKKLEEALETYQVAYNMQPSAGIQNLMNVVQENIRIRDENEAIEEQARKAEEERRAEEERIAEEERKRQEWERKRDDG